MMSGKKYIFVFFGLFHPLFVIGFSSTCAKVADIRPLRRNLSFDSVFITLTTGGVMDCARQCKRRTRCKAFDFDLTLFKCRLSNSSRPAPSTTGEEENNASGGESEDTPASAITIVGSKIILWPQRLASTCQQHTCPENSVCVVATNGTRTCEVECDDPPELTYGEILTANVQHNVGSVLKYKCPDGMRRQGEARCGSDGQWSVFRCVRMCLNTPVIENGQLSNTEDTHWIEGFELGFTCNYDFAPLGKLTCEENGSWSPAMCTRRFTSCSALTSCISDFPDGEYWLFPLPNSPDVAVKIFCSWQSNVSVVEYVTLPKENFAFFDPYRCNQINPNFTCSSVLVTRARIKVADNIIGMMPSRHLINSSIEECSKFPRFHNCPADGPCLDNSGTPFRVDLGQTGLIIDPSTQWRTTVGENVTYELSHDNTAVSGICEADCEHCVPDDGKLKLLKDPNFTPGLYTATAPVCVP